MKYQLALNLCIPTNSSLPAKVTRIKWEFRKMIKHTHTHTQIYTYTQYVINLLKTRKLDTSRRMCSNVWDNYVNHPGWNSKSKTQLD